MAAAHDLLLLDLDGTISDPLVGIGRSINHALSHFGFAPLQMSQVPAYIGPPLDESFRALTSITDGEQIGEFVAKYRERYAEIGYAENELYPGIPEALERLAAAGVPLGVCTSKRVDFAERILRMFGLHDHFAFVSGGEIGTHKWQQIERLLADRCITRSAVMVGDRAVDITAAHRNGLSAAGVLWGHGSREELEREQPRYLLSTPAQLPIVAGNEMEV
ncbi:MAG TPA: HAD-IA family hydrolase [Burkholderiaceae bacterium]|nr:HAD-IA family hydrolase [Burkholderiaceae bacterium]